MRNESPFVVGFIEGMFFTENAPGKYAESWDMNSEDNDGNIPCDLGYTDIEPESLESIREFCNAKQEAMAGLLEKAYATGDYDERQAGIDLWLTYNGHGVGYWDRKALKENDLGQDLSEVCGLGEVWVYSEDSLIYVEVH